MISRIRTGEISLWIQFTFYVASFLTVILRTSNSLADSSYYFFSGQLISQGQNPYSGDLPFFSGPAGGLFLFVVGKIFFIYTFPFVWQIINLVGISLFFFTILFKLGVKRNFILLLGIMLLSSPVREMVTNNQVTGFVLGLAAIVIQTSSHNLHTSLMAVNSILLYLMFELKPNLILGFILYFFFINKRRVWLILLTMFSTFCSFNLLLADNIYMNWLESVRAQGVANLTGHQSLGFSTFVYEIEALSRENSRSLGISLFLLCFAITLSVAFFDHGRATLYTVPLLAIFFPYLHYLDLAITVPFIVHFVLYRKNIRYLAPTAVIMLYLPRPTDGLVKNLFILVLLLTLIAFDYSRLKNAKISVIGAFIGVALILSNFFIGFNVEGEHQLQSITVLRSWMIISFVLSWQLVKGRGHNVVFEKKTLP